MKDYAAEFAFFARSAPTVPPPFCDHGGAKCSHQKHALVVNGVEGEPAELSLLRALVMTVQTCDGIRCRCCSEWFGREI